MNNKEMKKTVLVTGGAGFIGSHIVDGLIDHNLVDKVKVIDDLSTGSLDNLAHHFDNDKFEFIQGDITDYELCEKCMKGVQLVSHHAALGSIPRSIENPMRTNEVNVNGTVNILHAAKESDTERVVLAFSSSTYGDDQSLPKVESRIGDPLSPYAVSKKTAEEYAKVFSKTYGLDFIGLRYFNIFGPRQNPNGPYAAVIPLFCEAGVKGNPITINGDGEQSRDFTYVTNAVRANILALFTSSESSLNKIYNVACGDRTSLNQLVNKISQLTTKPLEVYHSESRLGDIKDSLADISRIKQELGYEPLVTLSEGLTLTYNWMSSWITEEEIVEER